MSKSTIFKKFVTAVFFIGAAIAGLYVSNLYFNSDTNSNAEHAIEYQSLLIYPNAKSFSGFKLTNQNSKEVTIDSFAGKWTLLFFGFTSCPDVCPTTLSELQKVFKQLEAIDLNKQVDVLFVSVDSDRDTPSILKDYIGFFNPKFNAATGNKANIISLTSQIGVAYHIEDHQADDKNYSVDHTAALFLIGPSKKLYGIFPTPHDANNITNDLTHLIGNKGK